MAARTTPAPVTQFPVAVSADTFPLTDAGNAERFIARHGCRVRFCAAMNSWFVWTGTQWKQDEEREVWALALDTARSIPREADDASPERQPAILRWAAASQSRRALEAMLALAANLSAAPEYGISVTPAALDADPWTLNTPTGLVDLRTGALRPHNRREADFHTDTRKALCSKITAATYEAGARAALWDAFLSRVLPDPEVRAFVQRAAGSSLVGQQREERLYFIHGPAATGKSTFMRAVQAALGTYATAADFETFLEHKGQAGAPREDLARLAGRRLVVSLEVDEGRKLAVGVVKALTGGDEIAARYLYGRTFTFVPAFSLWLVANVRPRVPAEDAAIWRRIVEVPFISSIPEAERDPNVKARLCDPAVGGPAVLAWLVEGCREWQRIGLAIPAAVRSATADYRNEVDSIGAFLTEETEQQPLLKAPAGALYAAYRKHCDKAGERPVSARTFKVRMEAHGFQQRKAKRGLMWEGLAVLTEEQGA